MLLAATVNGELESDDTPELLDTSCMVICGVEGISISTATFSDSDLSRLIIFDCTFVQEINKKLVTSSSSFVYN